MKIVNIKKLKQTYQIELDNLKKIKIFDLIKNEYKLYKGKEINEQTLFDIKQKNKIEELFQLALKKLAIKDYSPIKMKEFLYKKGANKKEINEVLTKLNKYSLINEDELIKRIIEFCDVNHYGYNRIISSLISRGISKDKVNNVIKDDKRESKEAIKQRERLVKRYKKQNAVNLKRNVYFALIRYGFDDNIAFLEASKVFNSHSDEINMLKLDYSKAVSSMSRKVKGKELNSKIISTLLSKGYQIEDIRLILKEENKNEMD